MVRHVRWLMLVPLILGAVVMATPAAQQNPFLGAWNMNGTGPDAANVYWLEVKNDGGNLTGLFLNRGGHALPLAAVKIENAELIFQAGQPGRPSGPEYRARIEGGRLVGHHTITQRAARGADPSQPAPAPTEHVVNWVGVRPPKWPAANANGKHTYGAPVMLFDGKTVDAFGVQVANRPMGWIVEDGVMTNTPPANNLVSKQKFSDFKLEVEYKLTEKSNSGIYIRGRYELQVLDDLNDTTTEPFLTHMAIYGRTPPLVKASKAVGEWQSMEAVVVANRITVTLNGKRVHDNAVIIGITGGALDSDELAPGPVMIQGDHEKVWVRKVVVTPITRAGQ